MIAVRCKVADFGAIYIALAPHKYRDEAGKFRVRGVSRDEQFGNRSLTCCEGISMCCGYNEAISLEKG